MGTSWTIDDEPDFGEVDMWKAELKPGPTASDDPLADPATSANNMRASFLGKSEAIEDLKLNPEDMQLEPEHIQADDQQWTILSEAD